MMPRPDLLFSILEKNSIFDVVEPKETIEKGQRISGFTIDVAVNGQWVPYGAGLNRRIPPIDQRATS